MNIFACDANAFLAVLHIMWWRHIVKMPLEAAQILWAVHHLAGTDIIDGACKLTHQNHPCIKWARASTGNYNWLVDHFEALCEHYRNYTIRRNEEDARKGLPPSRRLKVRDHTHVRFIEWFRANIPKCEKTEMTAFALVISPDELGRVAEYHPDGTIDVHKTYQNYVREDVAIDRVARRKARAGVAGKRLIK